MRPRRALLALLLLLSLGPPPALAQEFDANLVALGDEPLRDLAKDLGFVGTGTAASPIVIANLTLSANSGPAIELQKTTLHVRIRDVNVTSTSGGNDAIRLVGASNVVVERVQIQGARVGVLVERGASVRIHNSSISASDDGVLLDRSNNVTIEDNSLLVNVRAIHARNSAGNTIRGNAITAASGQVGFFVDDTVSWRNVVTDTNTVNDAPIHWHYGVHGTASSPKVLSNMTANVLGLTNVGQIVVVDASHVVIDEAFVANGGSGGIIIADSYNVTVRNSTAELNTRGVDIRGGGSNHIESSNLSGNGIGARYQNSPGGAVRNSTVARNSEAGLRLIDSSSVLATGNLIEANGIGVSNTNSATFVAESNNLSLNRNGGIRLDVRLEEPPRIRILNNTFHRNTPGIQFTAGVATELRGNNFTVDPTSYALQFAGVDTYNQSITTDNLVEGEPVQWHRELRGTDEAPIVLENLTVTARGVTNVAQILVESSNYVALRNVTVRNGSAAGILVLGGHHVSIDGANVSGNEREGILLENGDRHALDDVRSSGNRREGVLLTKSLNAWVNESRLDDNGGDGLRARDGATAQYRDLQLDGNQRSGLAAEGASDLRAVNLTIEGNVRMGISLQESHRSHYENLTIRRNGAEGVRFELQSSGNVLRNATIADNTRAGVSLDDAGAGNILWNLTISGHVDGVRFSQTTNTQLFANNVTALPQGYGLNFRDAESHATHAPSNNTVNGASIQWFSSPSGTPERPFVIRDLVVSTPRMTNLAQVVVTRASHVIIENVTATNGVAGLLVAGSSNVTVRGITASDGEVGIHVDGSQRVTLLDNDAPRNKVGVKLTGTVHSVVSNTSAAGAQIGVQLDGASTLNEVSRTESKGVVKKPVEDLTAREGRPGNNLIADAGMDIEGKPGANVTFSKATASAADDAMRSYTWDFGDGANETFPPGAPTKVNHAYASEGLYIATLAVRTESGREVKDTIEVLVEVPLGPPRALTARARDTIIALTWTPATGGTNLVHHVYRGVDDDEMVRIASTTAPEYRDRTADPGVSYLYQVSAERRGVEGPRSNTATAAHSVPEPDDTRRIFGISLPLIGGVASVLLVAVVVTILVRRRKKEEV